MVREEEDSFLPARRWCHNLLLFNRNSLHLWNIIKN